MYLPRHFEESRPEILHALLRAHPLATLVSQDDNDLDANHIPLFLDDARGVLRGHVARANPLWRTANGRKVLAVFHGPQGYITPAWYPAKAETGKVVPTWNYAVVHVHGILRAIEDTDWLRAQVEELTRRQEAALPTPWQVADAPGDYIENMLKAIVGIEIEIDCLIGKMKTSQNQSAENRTGVLSGLQAHGTPDALALAALVQGSGES